LRVIPKSAEAIKPMPSRALFIRQQRCGCEEEIENGQRQAIGRVLKEWSHFKFGKVDAEKKQAGQDGQGDGLQERRDLQPKNR
jgi:hypothetical protein